MYLVKFKSFPKKIAKNCRNGSLCKVTFKELSFCSFPLLNNAHLRLSDLHVVRLSFFKRETTIFFPSPITFLQWVMVIIRTGTFYFIFGFISLFTCLECPSCKRYTVLSGGGLLQMKILKMGVD